MQCLKRILYLSDERPSLSLKTIAWLFASSLEAKPKFSVMEVLGATKSVLHVTVVSPFWSLIVSAPFEKQMI